MQTSLYTVTIPVFINALGALKHILGKAKAYAAQKGIEPSALLSHQLAPDQFPLLKQVQISCDQAKGFAFRVQGKEPPVMEDAETTIEELEQRIDATILILKGVKKEDIDASENTEVRVKYFPGMHFTGFGYATGYVIRNFFFHVTTAYDILRNEGMPLGKADFVGSLPLIND